MHFTITMSIIFEILALVSVATLVKERFEAKLATVFVFTIVVIAKRYLGNLVDVKPVCA